MKFAKYLEEFNVNISALARKIGVSPSYLCDVKMGRRIPNEEMRKRIAEATNNKVKPTEWPAATDKGHLSKGKSTKADPTSAEDPT